MDKQTFYGIKTGTNHILEFQAEDNEDHATIKCIKHDKEIATFYKDRIEIEDGSCLFSKARSLSYDKDDD